MMQVKLKGTGVALITPFRKDSSIDFKSLEKITEHVINGGVDFLVVLGTTGEAATLSKDEKDAIINYVIDINNKRLPIVVGFGGNNTCDVVGSIKARNFERIDAILTVTPYYNKPSQEGLYEHYKEIACASPVPVVLYNVPGRTGVNMTAETTIKIASEIDNILAVKEASGNFDQITRILRDKPKDFQVISGDDGITLPLISIGACGIISVVANALPKEFSEMVNHALKGNLKSAQAMHYKLTDFFQAMFAEGNPAGVKAALEILGIISNNLRLPLTPVSNSHYKKLEKIIQQIKG
jgi:4-hydroxy-tetrahydrodipicolinate synthase